MSINIVGLKTALATVINTLTSKKVIWSDQNAPRPEGDYIAMKISSVRFVGGTDYYSKPNAGELSKTQGDREIVLSLTCVSENGMGILLELINKLELPSNLDLLCQNKLAYVNIESDPVDITTTINKSFETRSVAELIFRISKNYSSDTEDSVSIVNSIGISGGVDGDQQEDPFTIEMTVE
jgi:hypothetical protein